MYVLHASLQAAGQLWSSQASANSLLMCAYALRASTAAVLTQAHNGMMVMAGSGQLNVPAGQCSTVEQFRQTSMCRNGVSLWLAANITGSPDNDSP